MGAPEFQPDPFSDKRVSPSGKGRMVVMVLGIAVVMVVLGGGLFLFIAIPRFQTFSAKARQAEAKVGLTNLYTLQEMHYADTGSYTRDLQALGFENGNYDHYQFTCKAERSGFICTAKGDIDGDKAIDVWRINERKELVQLKDDIKQ